MVNEISLQVNDFRDNKAYLLHQKYQNKNFFFLKHKELFNRKYQITSPKRKGK